MAGRLRVSALGDNRMLGVSQSVQRALEIGSYQTAWAMLHRLRSVLVRPGRERLTGTVEVDETFIGGEEPGLRGGRAKGKKSLVGIAVEVKEPKGLGRCRMAILTDASAASLHPFVTANIDPITSSATSTSSCSASTAARRAAAAWSSTACSNSPSATNLSDTATSSSTPGPRSVRLPAAAWVTHPASIARRPTARGEPPDLDRSG